MKKVKKQESFLQESNRMLVDGKIVDVPIKNRFSFMVGDRHENKSV